MSRRADPEVSFEGIVDLDSLPPPASDRTDVYRSKTAVTSMTETLKEEILRAKQEARLHETEKTRAVPKFEMPDDAIPGFADEAPTRPKNESVPEKSGAVRRTDLPAVMVADVDDAESRVTIDITPPVFHAAPPRTAPSPVSFAETTPAVSASLPPIPRHAIWPRVLVFVLTLAALLVAAFALHRYRASSLWP
jgi:hypothetical protein